MTDTTQKPPTFTRLHFDDPRATSYITCSNAAAQYAYMHFPNPYSVEWRAASAGYDAGVSSAAASVEHWRGQVDVLLTEAVGIPTDPRVTPLRVEVKDVIQSVQNAPSLDRTPADIAGWETLAVGDSEPDTERHTTQCPNCDCLDGLHLSTCPDAPPRRKRR